MVDCIDMIVTSPSKIFTFLQRPLILRLLFPWRWQTNYNRQDSVYPMDEFQDEIVEDEPLRVLEIFPKRPPSTLHLTINNFHSMYSALSCPICEKLLKVPVYLKCSHRFCKECIEKYIRNNLKKTCPSCKGELSTKRDLRTDYSTQTIIKYAFKDPRLFSASFEQGQHPLLRSRSGVDFKKNDNYSKELSESEVVVPSIKRTRTEGEDIPPPTRGRKRRAPSEKKLQSRQSIQPERQSSTVQRRRKVEEKETKKVETALPTIVKFQNTPQAPSIQVIRQEYISKQRVKKKKIPIIDLASESQQVNEIQEIRKEDFAGEEKNICSINFLPEAEVKNPLPMTFRQFASQGKAEFNSSLKSEKYTAEQKLLTKNEPLQQKQKQLSAEKAAKSQNRTQFAVQKMPAASGPAKLAPINEEKQRQYETMIPEPQVMVPESQESFYVKQPKISKQALAAIQILKKQFKEDYFQKIVQLSPFSFYAQIFVYKHPLGYLVPDNIGGVFKFNLKANISSIAAVLGQMLNISPNYILLFVKKDEKMTEISHQSRLYEVNGRIWNNWKGVQPLETSQLFVQCSQNEANTKSGLNRVPSGHERALYYSVSVQKLIG